MKKTYIAVSVALIIILLAILLLFSVKRTPVAVPNASIDTSVSSKSLDDKPSTISNTTTENSVEIVDEDIIEPDPVTEDYPKEEKASGPLSVDGAFLVNAAGEKVQLKGLSTHGLAWYPDYVNENLIKELKEVWNADVLRLAMYTEEYGGYCSGGSKDNLIALIDKGVGYATGLGMYVIIDWHILSDNNPNNHKDDAITFFELMSEKYKDNDHVLYEICNEPNGGTTWKDIKTYAEAVIPAIRKNSPDSIIIVGTPTWSQEVDKAANDPITGYDNIMYALHFYADTHKDSLRKTLESAVKSGLPVFVTEYGICDASGNGAINTGEANKWMELLDKYSISSCAWNISNKGETSAIFKSSCSKKYGFSDSDLSDSGKWVLGMLTGNTSYDSSVVDFNFDDETKNTASDTNTSAPSAPVISSQSGTVSVSLTEAGSWESEGKTFVQYNITVTNNNSFDIGSWSGEVSFDSNIELSQGWCANYEVNGAVLKLTNVDFNGAIKRGESKSDIGCIICK